MRRPVLVLLAVLALPAIAHAAYFDGMFAYDRGDYPTALKEWTASARLGEAKSLYGLGQLHEGGHGVERDAVRAYVYYALSAARGFSGAESARDAVGGKLAPADLARARGAVERLRGEGRYLVEAADLAAGATTSPAPSASAEPARPLAESRPERAPAPPAKAPEPPPPRAPEPAPRAEASAPPPAAGPPKRRLDVAWVCDFDLRWRDTRSGGDRDVALYEPRTPHGYAQIGGYAQGNYDTPDGCVWAVRDLGGGPPLLAPPRGFEPVWTDRGSGAELDGSVWRAVAPGPDYVCLGSVAQRGYSRPDPASYACVHECLVARLRPTGPVWTDAGTGADRPVAIYRLYGSGSFVAVPGRGAPAEVADVNLFAACAYR